MEQDGKLWEGKKARGVGTRTRVYWCLLWFSSPDPLTPHILLKEVEGRDAQIFAPVFVCKNINICKDATQLVSQVLLFSPLFPSPSCVFISTPCRIWWGRNNSLLDIPTLLPRASVCLLHSFPHSSFSSWEAEEGKKPSCYFFTWGRVRQGLKNLSGIGPPPLSSLFYLVSGAAKLWEREEKEETHSFPLLQALG